MPTPKATTMATPMATSKPTQRLIPRPAPITTPGPSLPRLHVLSNGTLASVHHDGNWYLLSTGPEPKRPVLRLAGDADDAGLEPHICRSID
ncbi:hypothetical protein [Streptomyces sp. NPDC048419]|uniref:hypothetical protein n=1 Tax=Streptomyces sp. NPDC048419 TaxID=3365547 RepID=UPI00371DD7EA